jgi:hypothetical protein
MIENQATNHLLDSRIPKFMLGFMMGMSIWVVIGVT